MNIYSELKQLVKSLNEHQISYAICGGLALAVHGVPRATIDIDLMIEKRFLDELKAISDMLGFSHSPEKMEFKNGAIKIHRLVKFDQEKGDELMLDLLIVTPAIQEAKRI